MNITLIEPHGDDALISCSRILRVDAMRARKDILTLASRPSYGLRDYFNGISKMEFRDAVDFHWDNRPVSHHQVNHWHKDGLNTFDEYMELLRQRDDFIGLIEGVADMIMEFVDVDSTDVILAPLGVVHPYHCVVRAAIDFLILDDQIPMSKVAYYSEGPYNAKKYGQKLHADAIKSLGERGLAIWYPTDVLWHEDKEAIYRKVYPTETSLFRFSYDEVIRNKETFIGHHEALSKLQEVIE